MRDCEGSIWWRVENNIEQQLTDYLRLAVNEHASDLFLIPGAKPRLKQNGALRPLSDQTIDPTQTKQMIEAIYRLGNHRDMDALLRTGDDDFSFSMPHVGRFRCNAYRQRGSLAAVLRVVPFGLPDAGQMGIPESVLQLANIRHGLVLVTGTAGSGKSTTLACIIDRINRSFADHIVTIEDPIEFLYPHQNSIVSQREIPHDSLSFANALRASLRQAPDVILLGEMRDYETIQTAITAAETGHLLLSTLHTLGASKTIDRMIDVFPAQQQQQVRVQLSMVLRAVVSQQLVPTVSGELVPAFEVMIVNRAIANLIREGKVQQMDNAIVAGQAEGMCTMDADLMRLYRAGRITAQTAKQYAIHVDQMERRLPGI
ncbi:MAG: PilT/PilU family type 4a pilus ATPase [Clostridia bacterium]|nr:PilT/PilU family type 4a pilus ATPase [Clostridia bacterium]